MITRLRSWLLGLDTALTEEELCIVQVAEGVVVFRRPRGVGLTPPAPAPPVPPR